MNVPASKKHGCALFYVRLGLLLFLSVFLEMAAALWMCADTFVRLVYRKRGFYTYILYEIAI